MRTSVVLVALVAGAFFCIPLQAATVGSVEGEVLVNRGDGYRPVKGTLGNVSPGTQLMVRPGGSAVITYSGNCAVRIAAGVWSVNDQPPCADGRDFIDFTWRADRPVIDAGDEPVTETASVTKPAAASLPRTETWKAEVRVAAQEPSQEIGQPWTVYKTTTGDAPSTEAGETYRPPPPPEGGPPPEAAPEVQSGHQTQHYLIMGGLVAAGIGGAAVLLSQGGGDDPASP